MHLWPMGNRGEEGLQQQTIGNQGGRGLARYWLLDCQADEGRQGKGIPMSMMKV
jgi:hypothetical protein